MAVLWGVSNNQSGLGILIRVFRSVLVSQTAYRHRIYKVLGCCVSGDQISYVANHVLFVTLMTPPSNAHSKNAFA